MSLTYPHGKLNQVLVKHAALWDKLWRAGKLSTEAMQRISKGLTRHGQTVGKSDDAINAFRQSAKSWESARPLESLGGVSRNQLDDVMAFGSDAMFQPTRGRGIPRLSNSTELTSSLPTLKSNLGAGFEGGFFSGTPTQFAPKRPMIGMAMNKGVPGSIQNKSYRDVLRHELGHWKHYNLSADWVNGGRRKLDLSARMLFNRMRQASPSHFGVLQQSKGSSSGLREILAEYFAGTGHGVGARRFREFGLNPSTITSGLDPARKWQKAMLGRYGRNTPLANPAHHIVAKSKDYLDDVAVKGWDAANSALGRPASAYSIKPPGFFKRLSAPRQSAMQMGWTAPQPTRATIAHERALL
jgi:hypothetical protein